MGPQQTVTVTTLVSSEFFEQADNLEAHTHISEKPLPPVKTKARANGAYLDGLRGIAALGVFNHHLLGDGQSAAENAATASSGILGFLTATWIRLSYIGGTPGVCFFFILTGYVLSISSLNALAEDKRQQCRAKLLNNQSIEVFRGSMTLD